jgi:hypothetical protein
MATIIPFPKTMPQPVRGLTKHECDILDSEATGLILQGQASGVSVHNDGQYMCVYDSRGERYFIGREEGLCYLFDDEETMLAKSTRFDIVVQALEAILTSSEDVLG